MLSLADEELAPLDLTVQQCKKIVADNPLLSLFGMDNATDEEVTERSDWYFPLGHCSQQKRVSRVNCTVVPTALDTLFLMALG